ncbi:MAG: NTP transferase domain-containing protein [Sphingomonadaceae bacterium]|nr:NTP transferase domain-containing protein [Sphingomonadaceae bacterium]
MNGRVKYIPVSRIPRISRAGGPAAPAAPISLVMPMAGQGSRFRRNGITLPKPLIEIGGKPFFWWATQSVRRMAPVDRMIFVVLKDHVRDFAIDDEVRRHYPDAHLEVLDEPTGGAAETAARGVAYAADDRPVAICDSDHAFAAFPGTTAMLETADASLLCFTSQDPAYSYARFDSDGDVVGTVEKQVVSSSAIAGCYLFASPEAFIAPYERYRENCPYDEYFVSGVYGELISLGGRVVAQMLREHLSFGTPEELAALVANGREHDLLAWAA